MDAVIFGFSAPGIQLLDYIKDQYDKIVFCDNTSTKHGKYLSYEIVSVEEAVRNNAKAVYYVASVYHGMEMKEQLIKLGIKEDQIITELPDEIYESEKEHIKNRSLSPRDKLRFEINIARHCNLNCKSCDHFSPLSPEDFLDINLLERDLKRLSLLFNGVADQILILGGEPLLNKDVNKYMEVCRRYFNDARISIVTNGLLVMQMTPDFWDCMKKNRIILSVTKYPIKVNYDAIKEEAMKNGVEFCFFGITEAGRSFWYSPMDLEGKHDAYENFIKCRVGNWCINLDKGKLYPCAMAANIDIFNNYFGTKLTFGEDDIVDIYQVDSAEEITERLARPMDFCRYCNIESRTYDNPWEMSKCDIKEWS